MSRKDPRNIKTPKNLEEFEKESRQAHKGGSHRVGFLPIETNWFDRLFIGVIIWVALSLFWLRFVEPAGLSIMVCNAIAALLAVLIIWKG